MEMSEQIKVYKCSSTDLGLFMDWVIRTEDALLFNGMHPSVQLSLGPNDVCDWNLELLERGKYSGLIFSFESEKEKLTFEEEIKNKLNN
jgi:hypothetical protein